MMGQIFGKDILLKRFGCNQEDTPRQTIVPHVNLFVKVTTGCNAKCLFCSNANTVAPKSAFSIPKLTEILEELQSKGIKVNRLNITGGEPSVVPSLVVDILELMKKPRYDKIHVHLNTNGLLPSSQMLMREERWDSISMSLHHYDLSKLSELYGCRIPETSLRFNGIDLQKVNASCNLIKGYIDSPKEAAKMLDYAIDLNLPRIGFVALMRINGYCKEHFVDLEEIRLDTIPHVYFTKSMNRGSDCKCSNYLYNRNLKILEIYMRNYANPNYCESSLVYDGEYLRQGFHQNNIIY